MDLMLFQSEKTSGPQQITSVLTSLVHLLPSAVIDLFVSTVDVWEVQHGAVGTADEKPWEHESKNFSFELGAVGSCDISAQVWFGKT